MNIIAISGHAGAGKDTVADIIMLADSWNNSRYFQTQFPDKVAFIKRFLINRSLTVDACSEFVKIAFADKLKEVLSIITNTPYKCWYDAVFKDAPNILGLHPNDDTKVYTNRELMQLFGTEVGRNISKDIWVNSLFATLEDANYIITDVRFINEAEACLEAGATLIRVVRDTQQMSHSSETELDDYQSFDYIIQNDGSIEDLINKVINLKLTSK